MTLEGVLGTRSITVAELSALKADDVVALDAKLNAAVELRLNGVHVARGELVAVDDCFAVRITEIAPVTLFRTLVTGVACLMATPAWAQQRALAGGGVDVSPLRVVLSLVVCLIIAVLAILLIRQRTGALDLRAFFARAEQTQRADQNNRDAST